jgi:hypothetical protein
MPDQQDWRFCHKCSAMFFDGFPDKGACPAGGGHEAAGFNFALPRDQPENPNAQGAWRFCRKCNEMFFDGFPDKGVCARGGGHEAAGFVFVLPHDVPPTEEAQTAWRFCTKCHCMFFDGFEGKGVCPAGDGHGAAGFVFVLPHHDQVHDYDSGELRVPGDLPLSGSAHLVITRSGNFTFSTHAHDAGFDNIHYTLASALVTPGGIAVTFQHQGGLEGTSAGLPFGTPRRDDDKVSTGHNQILTDEFDAFLNGRFSATIGGSDVLTTAIEDALKDAAAQAGTAAVIAVTALVLA